MTPLRSKLEEILDIFDEELTTYNPDDEEYAEMKQKPLDQIIQAITELIEEAQPNKGSCFCKGNQICVEDGITTGIDEYKSNLLKGVRE